jgi:integrase
MGHSHYDTTAPERCAWNAGNKVGTKRPLKPRQVWAIRFFLDREQRLRDRALLDLAIDSKLRGCDLVRIKIGTLVLGSEVRTRAMVVQQKTGRPVQFELMSDARSSLLAWLERRGGTVDDYAFPSRIDPKRHMSTRQYARLVDEWVVAIGLRPQKYGTHSLRRTKASVIYKATGNGRIRRCNECTADGFTDGESSWLGRQDVNPAGHKQLICNKLLLFITFWPQN